MLSPLARRLAQVAGAPVLALLLLLVLSLLATAGDGGLIYSTYVGGNFADQGSTVAVDSSGKATIAGVTESTNFPTDTVPAGVNHGVDAWAARFSADGTAADYLLWVNAAALFAEDEAFAVAVDEAGAAYVAGQTRSEDFCAFFGAPPGYDTTYNGAADGFLFKVKADGSGVDYCTYLGGSDWDAVRAVAVDASGYAYVAGGTWSTDFPVTPGALQGSLAAQRDAFLMRIDPGGTGLAYATFAGGSGQDEAQAIAVDDSGDAVLVGWTNSPDLVITSGVVGPAFSGAFDAFLLKVEADGALAFGTYLGGSDEDRATGIALDAWGAVYLSGYTRSTDFPTSDGALLSAHQGGIYDGFAARLSPDAGDLLFSTYLGGGDADWAWSVAVDEVGTSYLAGETWSGNFPTTTLAFASGLNGARDAFVVQLNDDASALRYGTFLGGSDWDRGTDVAVDGDRYVYVTGRTRSLDFPTTPSAYNPQNSGDYDAFLTKLQLPQPAGPPFKLHLPLLQAAH